MPRAQEESGAVGRSDGSDKCGGIPTGPVPTSSLIRSQIRTGRGQMVLHVPVAGGIGRRLRPGASGRDAVRSLRVRGFNARLRRPLRAHVVHRPTADRRDWRPVASGTSRSTDQSDRSAAERVRTRGGYSGPKYPVTGTMNGDTVGPRADSVSSSWASRSTNRGARGGGSISGSAVSSAALDSGLRGSRSVRFLSGSPAPGHVQ